MASANTDWAWAAHRAAQKERAGCASSSPKQEEVESRVWYGWTQLCRVFVTRVEPCLRAGLRSGLRRALLSLLLWRTRRYWSYFYTVQTPHDEKRLRKGGSPWPTEDNRAQFGPGVYAWKHASDARSYRSLLLPRVPDLRILRFLVLHCHMHSMVCIDVDAEPDPEVWMQQHSLLWTDTPLPHGAQYIRRHTGIPRGDDTAIEHYFARSVFPSLFFLRG